MIIVKTLLLAFFLVSASSVVWAREHVSHLSAQSLVQQFRGEKPYPAPNSDVGKALSIEFASGYISGIMDSFEGETWCNAHSINSGDIKAYIQDYIEKLPETRRALAANILIREALKKRYPCN